MSRKLGKLGVGVMVILIAPQWLAFANQQTKQKPSLPNLSGTWVLDSKSDPYAPNDIVLDISQAEPEIQITEKLVRQGRTRQLAYYTDSQGERNPSLDGKQKLKSVTAWKDSKLFTEFSLPSNTRNNIHVVNERTDVWSLSSDGQTLTWTSLVRSSSRREDASVNPFGRPRGPDILATPLSWKQKRTFKRMP